MAYLHWVLFLYLFVPQGKAEAVFVIVWCPYKFLTKPMVIQECDCLALFKIPRQNEPMLCFGMLQADFPLVPLLASWKKFESGLLSYPKLDAHWEAKMRNSLLESWVKYTQQSAWWIRSVRSADIHAYCPLLCVA
jgi:hypothetical protein